MMKKSRLLRLPVICIGVLALIFTACNGGGGKKAKSANALLAGLSVSNCGTVSLSFSPDTFSYGPFTQGYAIAAYTITAQAAEPGQTITIADEATLERSGSLAVGSNTINITVTAANGVTKNTYSVTIIRAEQGSFQSPESNLNNIVITDSTGAPVVLNTPFSASTHDYSATVASAINAIGVTTELPQGASAAFAMNGAAYPSALESIPLGYGDNVLSVSVSGADGSEQVYVFRIRRQTTTAHLAALVITWNGQTENAITFDADTTDYDLRSVVLPMSVSSVTVQTTAMNAAQTVTIDGTAAKSRIIPLGLGDTTIPITVTSEDRASTRTYTIRLTRRGNSLPADISVYATGIDHSFNAGTTEYTYSVGYAVNTCRVTASARAGSSQTITINGTETADATINLAYGSNTITVVVSAPGADDSTYTITVNRAPDERSVDTTLVSLDLSGVSLVPVFSPARASYMAEVPNALSATSVSATTTSAAASVKINTIAGASASVDLSVGKNTIEVLVTAENPAYTRTYTVTVYRADGIHSNNSALYRIDVSPAEAELVTVFNPSILDYDSYVSHAVSRVHISPQRAESNQTVSVGGIIIDYDSGDVSVPVDLSVGNNPVDIVVTAEDGVSTRTYTVNFNRANEHASNNAALASLAVTTPAVPLSPSFYRNRLEYKAFVNADVAAVTITAAAEHTAASITVNGAAVNASGQAVVTLGDKGTDTSAKIAVTAEDGTRRTYTVLVSRAGDLWSNDAALSGLSVSAGSMMPGFASDILDYVVNVESTVSSLTVTATQKVPGYNAVIYYNGSTSNTVALAYGINTIAVKSVAQDGKSSLTYTLSVNRRAAGLTVYFLMPKAWKGDSNRSFINYSAVRADASTFSGTAQMTQLDAARDWWSYTIIDAASASAITFQNSFTAAVHSRAAGSRSANGYYTHTLSGSTYTWSWSDTAPSAFPVICVSASPKPDTAGYSIPFKTTKEITLSVGGDSVESCAYTLDGTDPATSASARYFVNGMKIIVGQGMADGDSVTLKLFARNASGNTAAAEYSYTRTGKELVVHFKKPKTWSGTPVIHLWVRGTGSNLWNITGWKLCPSMTLESDNWYTYTVDGLDSCGMLFLESNAVADNSPNITVDLDGVSAAAPWFVLNGTTGNPGGTGSGGQTNRAKGGWYATQALADAAAPASLYQ